MMGHVFDVRKPLSVQWTKERFSLLLSVSMAPGTGILHKKHDFV